MNGRLYIVTAYDFNHRQTGSRIDNLLFNEKLNSVFYFVGDGGIPDHFPGAAISEAVISPHLVEAGRKYLAEWTFLISELESSFAIYPFFVVSSRFHDKNKRLEGGLPAVWDLALEGLKSHGWGYLPSYDRDANFQDLKEYKALGRLGMKDEGLGFVDGFWGVRIPDEYRFFSDFFCNYIGFQSRTHFEKYMRFYIPFIRRFLDDNWNEIRDPELYVRRRDVFREEKPFSLYLEMVSHMFFYKNDIRFAGVSYDGLYDVDEKNKNIKLITPFPVSAP